MEVFGTSVDMNGNEILNLRSENVLAFPVSPTTGQIVMHTGLGKFYGWDGTSWINFDIGAGGGASNTVTSYRSSWEVSDGKIYDGYLLNAVITITREINGVIETATGLTDLETDWTNRLSLTFI
jgi:hypothetical protein